VGKDKAPCYHSTVYSYSQHGSSRVPNEPKLCQLVVSFQIVGPSLTRGRQMVASTRGYLTPRMEPSPRSPTALTGGAHVFGGGHGWTFQVPGAPDELDVTCL
jgi:hypothetical protein